MSDSALMGAVAYGPSTPASRVSRQIDTGSSAPRFVTTLDGVAVQCVVGIVMTVQTRTAVP